jgi:hypothetical protein
MSSKDISPSTSYLPVSWEFRETIEQVIKERAEGKVFFFDNNAQIAEEKGVVIEMMDEKNKGVYAVLDSGAKIRIDRIITLFGKIGAAYDEYDSYANACMSCLGGYEKDEL